MHIYFFVKSTVLFVVLSAFLFPALSYADAQPSVNRQYAKTSTLYHAIRGKPLAAALVQVAQRSGIIFKINADLDGDVVSRTIDADSWNVAIRALLANYNFVTIQESNMIKTVIISGRNIDGEDEAVVESTTIASAEDVIRIDYPISVMQIERGWTNDYYRYGTLKF